MLMTGARGAVKVPFLDLRPVHEPLKAGILPDVAELIDSSAFTNGPGQLADMRRLQEVAAAYGLTIVEDACHAHGAERYGLRAGTAGRAAAFGFYPGKNLGPMGDAGALVTDETASRAACARCASTASGRSTCTTSRATPPASTRSRRSCSPASCRGSTRGTPTAAGSPRSTATARAGSATSRSRLCPRAATRPGTLYVVRTADPAAFARFLRTRGIASGRHYPQPPHLSPAWAWAWLGLDRGALPVTEALAADLLSLPIHPGMAPAQVQAVVQHVREYFGDA